MREEALVGRDQHVREREEASEDVVVEDLVGSVLDRTERERSELR
jgi:hypothetical protein